MDKNAIITTIKEQGLLPLYYNDNPEVCVQVARALYRAGVRCIEFTNRGPQALPNFEALVNERANMPGLLLGVGTIAIAEEAEAFTKAGADFLVSPFFDEGVSRFASDNNILWMPGCMTPTEIHTARLAGCSAIKLFPGNVLQPGFLQAIKPLFKGLDFMVTGGVQATEESLAAWLGSGAAAVGMGSNLITAAVTTTGDYVTLEANTTTVLGLINTIKSKN
ncbi:ketohydroxyglutarate aldolase [Flavobacterium akiainvivens]|uniref:Ketohydroxyglutarate aldolase n=1 Tax=Flavobacterium akiainvivens TaxID=1202724 RepID=A0A0M9VHJ1_9FLAO|nr:ketohydroxyglutarate aldolase [Flavobacterium akiainvivens]KOS05612.1 ketohydroxyglutarate aldolase [Flavobacterium akiainvivens]SFQ35355.1 2-dehydro-3-deoxyphosphogluconate aldolase / (4S)-4-hydroxy-2-oxoglutarate aldolase [Flavobacterium akiainvivens]